MTENNRFWGWWVCSRTSVWDEDIPPCEEAVQNRFTFIDERIVDNPDKLRFDGDTWYGKGVNHRVVNGHIMRDFPGLGKRWVVNIRNGKDLDRFISKYGRVIINNTGEGMSIEIYDDYRE